MKCPNCGSRNAKKERFCGKCGATLPTVGIACKNCGTVNKPNREFCAKCGKEIEPDSKEKVVIQRSRQRKKKAVKIVAVSILSVVAIILLIIFTAAPNIVVVSFSHRTEVFDSQVTQTTFWGTIKNAGNKEGGGTLHYAIDVGNNWHVESHGYYSHIQPGETVHFNVYLESYPIPANVNSSAVKFTCWFVNGEI